MKFHHYVKIVAVSAVGCLTAAFSAMAEMPEAPLPPEQVAERIDQHLARHWETLGVEPAANADDATVARRLYLDLAGRIPTVDEVDAVLADDAADKRARLARRLIGHAEFAFHFGGVLDQMIQGSHAGHEPFVDYLRRSVAQRKPWDAIFREIMLGPWDSDERKAANRFLDRRARDLAQLTVDATRVFFGVDISCAQCHDHPLVIDWTQEHFYGMASFFNRTTGGRGEVGEKKDGEVTFLSGGEQKTAQVMFLDGQVAESRATSGEGNAPEQVGSRRELLVHVALEQRTYFSRAIVNRVWEYFFGTGLVDPVDQIHSENEPSVPELLEWLADDFAESGYDLHRLVESIVLSRAYQRDSRWESEQNMPNRWRFAVARLRPLDRGQMAASLLLAAGAADLSPPDDVQRRAESLLAADGVTALARRIELEAAARPVARRLDPRSAEFQSSAAEALYLSNAEEVQRLFAARDGNLADRLAKINDARELVQTAVRSVLSRPATNDEIVELSQWLEQQPERKKACEQLLWALASSAEFRFIH